MTDMAARNRSLKKVLEQAFGRGKVSVRGSRGTAYGWVRVHIGYGQTINIDFDHCREQADPWGDSAWRHHLSAEDWDRIQLEQAA